MPRGYTVRPVACVTCEAPLPPPAAVGRLRLYCSKECSASTIGDHDPIPQWQAPGVDEARLGELKGMSREELVMFCDQLLRGC